MIEGDFVLGAACEPSGPVGRQVPNMAIASGLGAEMAAKIAARVLGRSPCSVDRFGTGARHYVFDLSFDKGPPVVVRLSEPSAHGEMAGAVYLSQLLRPLGVPLPALLACDLEAEFPWLLLERLPGKDLGAVAPSLSEHQLDRIAAEVARAQAITATTGSAGRYGYAARPEDAPHYRWSQVLEANLARSRRRIISARLFDVALVDIVQDRLMLMRREFDEIAPTPFLHDTTTKNVIVTPEGAFSGIVDVDDLCFGDPRYPAALTLAAMTAYGGPVTYVSAWLRHARQSDDRVFRLYVLIFLLDLMSEHGQVFNGNSRLSTSDDRSALRGAVGAALAHTPLS
jgi:aminoglycoside phosphotransferase (APT) family kinase protein